MLPENRVSTHPGVILAEEFLGPLGVNAPNFAEHIGVPPRDIEDLVASARSVDASLAWRIAMALGTTPQFWMNLQSVHDLTRTRPAREVPRLAG